MSATGAEPKKRILVVEDDPDTRRLVQTALRAAFDIETAENGSVALARVSRPPAIDLIICDVMMPQMNGLTFARQMRLLPNAKSTPLIFLTAKDGPTDLVEGINAGARHYVLKPFKVDDLLKKVQKILSG